MHGWRRSRRSYWNRKKIKELVEITETWIRVVRKLVYPEICCIMIRLPVIGVHLWAYLVSANVLVGERVASQER
jgi:hypothetical protein